MGVELSFKARTNQAPRRSTRHEAEDLANTLLNSNLDT